VGCFREKVLEDPQRDPDHPAVLADFDLNSACLPFRVPACASGNDRWETVPLALSFSKVRLDKSKRTSGEGRVR
jgi:hypothetical protein